MQKHSYARFCDFQIENLREDRVTFLLHSNKESKKQYPFDYVLYITYILEKKTLKVRYEVKYDYGISV